MASGDIQYLKHLLGDLDDAGHEVAKRQDTSELAAGLEGFGDVGGDVMSSDLAKATKAGMEALDLLKQKKDDRLTDAQVQGLEAIVHLEGRPSITIRDGDFEKPPVKWSILREHRVGIKESIRRVGRIEMKGHKKFDWIGTGFLVAPNAVITNRHVANAFSEKDDAGKWIFRDGMSSSVDFVKEHQSSKSLEFVVTEVVGCHHRLDVAVLRVESTSSEGNSLPDPVTLSSKKLDDLVGRRLYVIGYPAKDETRNVPKEMERIFAEVFDVKRLLPGLISKYKDGKTRMEHDCSTLGGNSGSPVFDLETHEVVGLHYGGSYKRANYAVPFWMLTSEDLLKGVDANFA